MNSKALRQSSEKQHDSFCSGLKIEDKIKIIFAQHCLLKFFKNKPFKERLEMQHIISTKKIAGKIYFIRESRVMLDHDLAELYGVETRVLNQAVRRKAN